MTSSTDEAVIYGHSGDASGSIGGLTSGQTYYVRVINPNTIKLCLTQAQATQTLATVRRLGGEHFHRHHHPRQQRLHQQ